MISSEIEATAFCMGAIFGGCLMFLIGVVALMMTEPADPAAPADRNHDL
jgi:hypothetical protein